MADDDNGAEEEGDRKKAKLDDVALIGTVWEHYRNYLNSCEEEDNEQGDEDELIELLESLDQYGIQPSQSPPDQLNSRKALLPVLASVAHFILVDQGISNHLLGDAAAYGTVRTHLHKSLEFWPHNAAAWSMGANFGRMTQLLTMRQVASWYQRAADAAVEVRRAAVQLLDDDTIEDSVKEWIELLLLNQVTGVEYTVDDGVKEDEKKAEEEEEDSEDDGYWSASSVESTARFMSAMILSTIGDHDGALQHLKKFPLTHRLHPNLWKGAGGSSLKSRYATMEPTSFRGRCGGLLPTDLYQRLCQVFAPDAAYWKESDYAQRGYYSYFMDLAPADQPPSNLIDDVIRNHLLPLARQKLSEEAGSIVGVEWWTHTRPIRANLGHNLHFDTDEALLSQQQKITHPILSSVLYLTGDEQGGATICLDQTSDSDQAAAVAWRSVPSDNSLLVFPGNLLHGVLPCPGKRDFLSTATSSIANAKVTDLPEKDSITATELESPQQDRLSFMVGFWTRRVPDQMKEQKLYGPCGPLPPATDEHTWVREIQQGYQQQQPSSSSRQTSDIGDIASSPVLRVAPAWEEIQSEAARTTNDDHQPLEIPHAIDHRFFVRSPSHCFRDSLFERDEFDETESL